MVISSSKVFDSDRMVEGVEDGLVTDTVAVGGLGDERLLHQSQVTLYRWGDAS